jgi:hypothetical protein
MAEHLTFVLTDDHIKLLQRAYVRWDDCEYGAPGIDCKRPYGNSSVEFDIAEILGWDLPLDQFESAYLTKEQADRAEEIHRETLTALQIVLRTGAMTPGTYRRSKAWKTDWELNPER